MCVYWKLTLILSTIAAFVKLRTRTITHHQHTQVPAVFLSQKILCYVTVTIRIITFGEIRNFF